MTTLHSINSYLTTFSGYSEKITLLQQLEYALHGSEFMGSKEVKYIRVQFYNNVANSAKELALEYFRLHNDTRVKLDCPFLTMSLFPVMKWLNDNASSYPITAAKSILFKNLMVSITKQIENRTQVSASQDARNNSRLSLDNEYAFPSDLQKSAPHYFSQIQGKVTKTTLTSSPLAFAGIYPHMLSSYSKNTALKIAIIGPGIFFEGRRNNYFSSTT